MATFRQRADRWQARVQRQGYPDVAKTFNTRQDADKWARAVEREQDLGAYVFRGEAERTTLAELLERYGREVSPIHKGHREQLWKIGVICRDRIADYSLVALSPKILADYRDRRLKVVTDSTVRNELNLISSAFRIAGQEWGIPIANPVLLIRKPGAGKERSRRISPEELEAVVTHSKSSEFPYLLRLAVATGMRRGEIALLRWDDINVTRKIAVLHETKTGDGRVVPLSSKAISILLSIPRRLDGKIFGMKPNAFSKAMRVAVCRARESYRVECEELGINPDQTFLNDIRLHDARHEAVSGFFEQGLDVMEVASISGHKTLGMLRRYTHLRAEKLALKLG